MLTSLVRMHLDRITLGGVEGERSALLNIIAFLDETKVKT